MHCLTCGKLTDNPKFCSNSCAATYNNRHFPKRHKKENFCVSCGAPAPERRKYCDNCAPNLMNWSSKTIADLRKDGYDQTYRIIRMLARRIYTESGKNLRCAKCGYETYVEICHIKAINSFSKNALISEVNALNNLIALCPTHHWEFDNGLLDLNALGET